MNERDRQELRILTNRLLRATFKLLQEKHRPAFIVPQAVEFVRSKVTNFDYNQGRLTYKLSTSRLNKVRYLVKDDAALLSTLGKTDPDGMKKLLDFAASSKMDRQEFEKLFVDLVTYLLRNVPHSEDHPVGRPVDPAAIRFQVSNFVGDVFGDPITTHVSARLQGIVLEDQRLSLGDGIVLRRPEAADLEVEQPSFALQYGQGHLGQNLISALLEFDLVSEHAPESQYEVYRIVDVLRLFRLGGVGIHSYTVTPRSFRMMPGGTFGGASASSPFSYSLRITDLSHLRKSVKVLKNIIPNELENFELSNKRWSPLSIPFPRYLDAILKGGPVEGRITSAITCLEGLYFKESENLELSHRLGQRVSVLLRTFGSNPLEVVNNVKLAYGIRSRFVHGHIDLKKRKDAPVLLNHVADYARMSIQIFAQLELANEKAKDRFLEDIDNALVDAAAARSLASAIPRACKVRPAP